jgi:hypothetical protein
MRSTLAPIVLAAAGVFAAHAVVRVGASTGPIPLDCDRSCLEGLVSQYLAAVVAHDPRRLPLSEDVMYTENDQVMKVGDGFWKTAAGAGNYKHVFADPEFGQVALMGTMQEAGSPLLFSLRLRVELGRITEIESVYFRSGGGGPNNIAGMDQGGKVEDIWLKSIPPARRLSRQQMISIADGYFTGLQKNDGKGIHGTGTYPFTNDCAVESPSALSPRRQRARRGLVACRVRPGHGERRRAVGWKAVQVRRIQPAWQHPRDGGVSHRGREDPAGRDDRSERFVPLELALAGQPERKLAAVGASAGPARLAARDASSTQR